MNTKHLFELGKQAGLEDIEVYYTKNESFSCKVFEQAIDSYSVSQTEGLSIRGLYNGKIGYTYTEQVNHANEHQLIQTVINHAKYIEKEESEYLYEGSDDYIDLSLYDAALNDISAKEKIDFLKSVETIALGLDSRVKSVSYCLFSNGETTSHLQNSKGLDLIQRANYAYAYLNVVVSNEIENKEASTFILSTNFSNYQPDALAQDVVTKALSKLGGKAVKSNQYDAILSNEVSSDLLEAMTSCFSAEAVLKNMSLLKDKCHTVVASPLITLVDDPHLPNGLGSCAFDGEGVATTYKELIKDGTLQMYLHSLATAKTMKTTPTGNGMRSSYKSNVMISPSNLYIKPGHTSFETLCQQLNHGIYITDVAGLHSGLNTISGDFSLAASGYLIEDGKISTPVSDITISGNFFTVLKEISGIGDDLFFNLSAVGSPSLRINDLSISGE